jgi:hypothetical protein
LLLQADPCVGILQGNAGQDVNSENLSVEAAESRMKAITLVTKLLLDATGSTVPEPLVSLMIDLHDNALLSIPNHLNVQEVVARLCLEYWELGGPSANLVSVQMVRVAFHEAELGHHTSRQARSTRPVNRPVCL